MARRKKKNLTNIKISSENKAELTKNIITAIKSYVQTTYGDYIEPETIFVKTKIKLLDALLGGDGFILGLPIMFTGPAEIGKTTLTWQLIKSFQEQYPESLIVYIDTEGGAYVDKSGVSRVSIFGINQENLAYFPVISSLEKTFDIIKDILKVKEKAEKENNVEPVPALVVIDSISDLDPEKIYEVDNPTSITGLRARLIQFLLGQIKPLIRKTQTLLVLIDQVRSNISDSLMMFNTKTEKEVSTTNNLKSSTGQVKAVEHRIRHWLFFSRGPDIYDKPDILGNYLDIKLVKSKTSMSGITIRTVFDKRYGIDDFWTSYHFISNLTPFEEQIFKKLDKSSQTMANKFKSQIEQYLGIEGSGAYKYLVLKDEKGNVIAKSKSFYERDAKKLYETDREFKELFDKIVEYNIQQRIYKLVKPYQNNESSIYDAANILANIESIKIKNVYLNTEDEVEG